MKIHSILASSLGNIMEWYDFGLFIYLAPIFAHLFFPTEDKQVALLAVYSVFALGFISRPLGAIILGHFGDRIGRVKTLRASILLISIPTFLVGCLPTYQMMGIFAPLILILLRLISGVSIGGEYAGIMIYLAETAPVNKRAFIVSFSAIGANVGFLLATFGAWWMSYHLSSFALTSWGWRIPFLFGGLIGLTILYLRSFLQETSAFKLLQREHHVARIPLKSAFLEQPQTMLKIIGLVCLGAILYYTIFTYLNNYLGQVNRIKYDDILKLQSYCLLSMLILVPLAGMLCDRIGRKGMFLIFGFGTLILSIPCFILLKSPMINVVFSAMMILTIFSSMEQGTTLITVVENVPLHVRYTTIAIAYNIGNMLFGGITPLMLSSILRVTHNDLVPAYYLIAAACVTLCVVIFALKETKGTSLLK
jgi:MHS family proline/betaine transporter-like MFS transporter